IEYLVAAAAAYITLAHAQVRGGDCQLLAAIGAGGDHLAHADLRPASALQPSRSANTVSARWGAKPARTSCTCCFRMPASTRRPPGASSAHRRGASSTSVA